jgi:hypothetical protein
MNRHSTIQRRKPIKKRGKKTLAWEITRRKLKVAFESARKYDERIRKAAETHDEDLAKWVSGESIHRHFDVVRLRIKGEKVETSTGFVASVAAVRKAVPFVKRFRRTGWRSIGTKQSVDEHPITRIGKDGVLVGCTLVEWSEVERISKLMTV